MSSPGLVWQYITREYQFRGPAHDEWPGRKRYAQLLDEQETRKKGAERRSIGLLDPSVAFLSKVGREGTVDSDEGQRLIHDYLDWRFTAESDYLNQFGAAGFELVSVTRDIVRKRHSPDYTLRYASPRIPVFPYFKRPATRNAPEPPRRSIGFQPRDAR